MRGMDSRGTGREPRNSEYSQATMVGELDQTAECYRPYFEPVGRLRPLIMQKAAQVGWCGRWIFGEAVATRRVVTESDALWIAWFKHKTHKKDSSQWEARGEAMPKYVPKVCDPGESNVVSDGTSRL